MNPGFIDNSTKLVNKIKLCEEKKHVTFIDHVTQNNKNATFESYNRNTNEYERPLQLEISQ